ncbi:hypothetical protein [Streptomyces sp. 058-1L]|uniref:hypothetical protein n=1 Tax=Streptomyces sp. 058-1L TaxID=2789266 RepID=UPI00397EA3E5
MRFFAAAFPVLFFAREEALALVFFAVAVFEEAAPRPLRLPGPAAWSRPRVSNSAGARPGGRALGPAPG